MLGDPYFRETLGYMAIYSFPFYLFLYIPIMATILLITKNDNVNKFMIKSSIVYVIFFLFALSNWN